MQLNRVLRVCQRSIERLEAIEARNKRQVDEIETEIIRLSIESGELKHEATRCRTIAHKLRQIIE